VEEAVVELQVLALKEFLIKEALEDLVGHILE
jgi:hypothetical protein